MRKHTFLFKALILISTCSFAQQWRSQYYPENWTPPAESKKFYSDAFIQDFSYAGYHTGNDPIPNVTNNIIDVTKAPYNASNNGTTDVTTKIQQAIDKAGNDGGGVVYLPAGTYRVSAGSKDYCLRVNKNNVIIRGAGKNQTFIYNHDTKMRGKTILEATGSGNNWYGRPSTVANITRDLMGPTKVIPVNRTDLFNVGDYVIVHHNVTDAWAEEQGEPEWKSVGSLRGVTHFRKVTAIDANAKTITIDIPTRFVFRTRDGAAIYKNPTNMLSEVGFEEFSIGNREIVTSLTEWTETNNVNNLDDFAHNSSNKGAYDTHLSYAIKMDKCRDSWMKNVSSYSPPVNQFRTHVLSCGIGMAQSARSTLDGVYMGFAQYGAGANAYGYRMECNDVLVKNSTAEYMRHGFVFSRMYCNGNVLHKVTDIETGRCTGNSPNGLKTQSSTSDFHNWFSVSCLIDQMTLNSSAFSAVHRKNVATQHNAVTAHSVFWNTEGNNSGNGYVIRTSQSRYGYIVGTKGNTPTVNYKLNDKRNLGNNVSGSSLAFVYDQNGSRTAPIDLVEGMGQANTLEPQSLYLDQLAKRLGGITVTNNPPTGSFEAPSVNSLEEGFTSLYVKVNASDPDGDNITDVALKINGTVIRVESGAPYEWGREDLFPDETLVLNPGSNLLEAIITDAKGASTTISKTITVTERGVTNYSPIHDAYTEGTTGKNDEVLRVENGNRITYLSFDLSEINASNIISASLSLTVADDNGNGTLKVYNGSGNWTESGINSGNAPSKNSLLDSKSGNFDSGNEYTFDVNDLTVQNGIATIIIEMDAGGNDVSFGSKDQTGVTQPNLRIKVDEVTSLENGTSKTLQVFPNPSADGLFHLTHKTNWTIVDALGTEIKKGMNTDINISEYSNGIYFVKTTNGMFKIIYKK